MDKTKWIIFTLIVVAFFGGIVWISKQNEANSSFNGDANKVIQEGAIPDHTYGVKEQKVTFIEYGDYQCPGCGSMYEPVKAMVEQYKGKVTFVFRNLPLTNIHPNALAAATAAEAAGLQGKFWEMHDALYQSQDAWKDASVTQREGVFTGYASQLGLNVDQFKKDLTDQKVIDKINRDRSTARKLGVDSTPTFVLNGVVIKGQDAVNAQVLLQKVEEAIKTAYPDEAPAPQPQQ
jgi:protein-disulfide isomerase